jgi:hypothetical protein
VTPPRAGGAEKNIAIFAAKLVVTGGCFLYVFKQVDPIQTLSGIAGLDLRWAAFATFIVMLQIPLVALRWRNVLGALAACDERMTRAAMIAITAIGFFFAQVLPSVASEGVRAWLLVRLDGTWRYSVARLVIDRGVGVGLLIIIGFGVLLLPSGLNALGGYRDVVLIVYGALLAAGLIGLLLAARLVPYLARWRYSRWTASLIGDAERVLLGPRCPMIMWLGCLHHALIIVVVWSVARAQGLALTFPDAAALFTIRSACCCWYRSRSAAGVCTNSPRSRCSAITASGPKQRCCSRAASAWSMRLARCPGRWHGSSIPRPLRVARRAPRMKNSTPAP